jgi:restriction system protein
MQFAKTMQPGDWVALPSKSNPTIQFGKIAGPYEYDPKADDRYRHPRKVEWFAQDIPRDRFAQDILYSLEERPPRYREAHGHRKVGSAGFRPP